jgi:hypothetical protein
MFLTIMPWLMTLAPMNEAIRHENYTQKNLKKEKTFTVMIWVIIKDVRIVSLSKKCKTL